MSLLKSFKNKLLKGAQNNLSLAVYSIILAILVWFVISMTFYPSVPKTIDNVALNIDISGTPAAESGLSVIDCNVESVKVRIKGSRTQVGNMNSDSLTAYIDAENVTTTGKKTLNIKIKSNSNINYEVDSITPSTATVVFDKYDTREFQIRPEAPNITAADGKTIDDENFVCEPDVISITGPSAQLDKISKCYAVSEKSETLTSTYTIPSDKVILKSEDGSIIDQSMMTLNKTSFLIKVPVLTQKTAKLTVALTNAPTNFDTEWLMSRLSLSSDSIIIASGTSQSNLPDILEIGSIKLSDLKLDYSSTFDVDTVLKNYDLKNLSNVDNVVVSFDSSGLDVKDFIIAKDDIHIRNKPSSDYDYDVVSNSLKISVIGPTEVLEELTSKDFTAEANLLGTDVSSGNGISQFSSDVTISCSDYKNVWSTTKSKIVIEKTPKPTDSNNKTES